MLAKLDETERAVKMAEIAKNDMLRKQLEEAAANKKAEMEAAEAELTKQYEMVAKQANVEQLKRMATNAEEGPYETPRSAGLSVGIARPSGLKDLDLAALEDVTGRKGSKLFLLTCFRCGLRRVRAGEFHEGHPCS